MSFHFRSRTISSTTRKMRSLRCCSLSMPILMPWSNDEPPDNVSSLAMVGYTAFRWVTQIDPLWNAYLLGLVLSLADKIEQARVSLDQEVVFSYRYQPDDEKHHLFADKAWREFNLRSVDLASRHSHVIACDISDFYARIYHHRLENALLGLKTGDDIPRRIIRILSLFSQGTSYGLPVGGQAARLLSELLLNRVDRLLLAEGVTFCRFADDYHLFTNSREDAYDALRFLTEKLLQNEGLTLQRAKTRILDAKDFLSGSAFATNDDDSLGGEKPPDPAAEGDTNPEDKQAQRSFLALSLRYDPYSPTAEDDYADLKAQIERFDVVGMLARELSKSRIHSTLARRLIQAIRYLDGQAKEGAARSLIDNIETLAPVYPNVMRALAKTFDDFGADTRAYISTCVRDMLNKQRHYAIVPVNMCYSVGILSREHSEETERLFAQIYESSPPFVQRDIMLAMGRWGAAWWLSDRRPHFAQMHPWVQRAFLVSSYSLGDEGKFWRRKMAKRHSQFNALLLDWSKERFDTPGWVIPF